ncbi:MAG TPA: hypothetical protein VK636_10160 [Gemmatimonadaceae bacterium]|nr:hypothetical protein [Gemmatimonadaceae bacterium]
MSAKSDPRNDVADSEYFYRRSLSVREIVPAIGVAVAAGLVAFYLTQTLMRRTPLEPELVASRRRVRAARAQGG